MSLLFQKKANLTTWQILLESQLYKMTISLIFYEIIDLLLNRKSFAL
jgi:hypothetical protein